MEKKRSIQEIRKKIESGKAVIMTATELCDIIRAGKKISMKDVDVVTSATRGIMSGTLAILSFKVCDKRVFQRATEVYLNDVPAVPGPAPNENLGWIDCIVMGTAKNTLDENYGGGHLFRNLVEGKEIKVRVKTIEGKEITTTTSLKEIPYAMMLLTRGVCVLMAYINPLSESLKTIFSVKEFSGNLSETTFSGCGEISPIKKDPNFHTFGVGTKILLNASVGYIMGRGTLSTNTRRNFSGFADMHNMEPEYMGGFKTSASPEVINTWAVPIPIVNEEVFRTACIIDNMIEIPIVDVYGRDPLGNVRYSDLWIKDGIFVKYDINKCRKSRNKCLDNNGNFYCPPQGLCPMDAFTLDKNIDYKRCYYCGTCVAYCLQGVCYSKMGNITLGDKKIPVVLRHSDRLRAEKLSKVLKAKLLSGEFKLSESVDKIKFD